MNEKRISISEAAKQFGLARKTVQRAVTAGVLNWEGPRRGRYASGLDPEEVADKLCRNERRRNTPAHLKVVDSIERARGDWRLIFGALLTLIHQGDGTDLDLVAAAFACLHAPRHTVQHFVSVIDGRSPGGWSYSRHGLRVGYKVMECLHDFGRIPEDITAGEAWAKMRDLLLSDNAPQSQAHPRFFFDLPDCKWPPRSISLKLVPSWDSWPKASGGGKWKLNLPAFENSTSPETVNQRLQKMDWPRQRVDAALNRLCDLAGKYTTKKKFNEEVFGLVLSCLRGGSSRQHEQLIAETIGYSVEDLKVLTYAWNVLHPRFSDKNRFERIDGGDGFDKAMYSISDDDVGGIYAVGNSQKSYSNGKHKKSNNRHAVSTVARVMGVSAPSIWTSLKREKDNNRSIPQ